MIQVVNGRGRAPSLRLQALSLGYEGLAHVLQSPQLSRVLLRGLAERTLHFVVQLLQTALCIQKQQPG